MSRRRFYTLEVNAAVVREAKPGDALRITLPRLGLAAGKAVMLVSKSRRVIGPVAKIKVWG
jgi:hypothetical protein